MTSLKAFKIMVKDNDLELPYHNTILTIEQELRALEIIKEMLDNNLIEKLNANSRKIFKDVFDNLPKEKQDLLKEVLL